MDEVTAAVTAASSAVTSAAVAMQSFSELSNKIERSNDRIFSKLDLVTEKIGQINQNFAVHVAESYDNNNRLTTIEHLLEGENGNGMRHKIERLWLVDQLKLWGARVLVGCALSAIAASAGFWLRHIYGW